MKSLIVLFLFSTSALAYNADYAVDISTGAFKICRESNDSSEALRMCIWSADDRCGKKAKATGRFETTQEVVGVACPPDENGNIPTGCNMIEYTVCNTFVCTGGGL